MKVKPSTDNKVSPSQTESDARLRALLEAAVDAVISIDEGGVVQLVNPAAERLFGYSAQELIGQNVSLLMPSPHREDHDGYIARYLATGEKRIIGIGREVIGLRKDGTTFPMDLSVAEARVGRERLFVGILRDITARKKAEQALRDSEERFRLLVEGVRDHAVFMLAPDGRVASWNAGAEHIYGYQEGEILGRHFVCLFPPEEVNRAMPQEVVRRAEAEGHFHVEGWRVRKDGARFWADAVVTALRDEQGRLRGFVNVTRDATERKRAEEALRESKADLERVVAELREKNDEIRAMTQQLWQAAKLASVGELAASIAHELNNPLATVSLRIESVLARTPAEDPRHRALEVIAQETRRMGELVANLLQFSRRGDGQVSTVDLRQELTKAVELVHHHLRKRLITVVQEFAPDSLTLYADRQKLRQVFLNLLTNASDAMPQGGTLTLRAAPASLDGGKPAVLLEFVDTGVGIPAEHLGRVLEPFFTTKEEGKGTGLGLAICRRVVQEHHGTIQIASEPGKGTTVRLLLPVKNGTNVGCLRGAGSE